MVSDENIGVSDDTIGVSDDTIGVSDENIGVSDEAAGGVSDWSPMMMISSRTRSKTGSGVFSVFLNMSN